MTDKELKEKILAEIERLINELGEQRDVNLEDLRDFINSLPEEPVSEELEKAADEYADGENPTCPCEECLIKTFKAGAQWQKEHMLIKACEFIRTPNIYVVDINHYGGATTNYEATVEKFKKYMED